jgi:hypothetical protein
MIRIEPIKEGEDLSPTVKTNPHLCNACGYDASSEKDLQEHVKVAGHPIFKDEAAEAETKKKRGPGRPKKQPSISLEAS